MHMLHFLLQLHFLVNIQRLLLLLSVFVFGTYMWSIVEWQAVHVLQVSRCWQFFALWSLATGFRHPYQSFLFLNIFILSFKDFSMIHCHLSRGYFFWQATHNSRPVVLLLSAMVAYVINLFLLCLGFYSELFDDLSQYWSVADFKNSGSKFSSFNVSSFRSSIKSTRPDSLICLLLMFNTRLTHSSLVWLSSLASNMHMTSGVSSWFHCADCVIL